MRMLQLPMRDSESLLLDSDTFLVKEILALGCSILLVKMISGEDAGSCGSYRIG